MEKGQQFSTCAHNECRKPSTETQSYDTGNGRKADVPSCDDHSDYFRSLANISGWRTPLSVVR